MKFLVRLAFWLVILILLIPTDEAKQKQIYGTVRTALNDVASFCDRNPRTCTSGQEAFDTLMHKAQSGGEMIMALVEEHTGISDKTRPASILPTAPKILSQPKEPTYPMAQREMAASPAPPVQPAQPALSAQGANSPVMPVPSAVPLEPLPGEKDASQNTLKPQDLRTSWGAPSI